ncbi:MAG: CBS domain-containing protein [Burkholderiaceae bacterium]|nr:CBS domain-containing protein [Burkholderiaceae bacterium]
MPLYWYRRPRLVVLSSKSSVLEAARAMENNSIGAIVVQDRGRIVGVVTDRDLAVRALGHKLDPENTAIAEVMTPSPLTLTLEDSREEAIALMQQGNVRRIPLSENGRVVGMVTLDDLLLDEAAPLDELAAIVQAQIGEGGPAESPRSPARRRSLARAEATLSRLINAVQAETGLADRQQTRTAIDTALALLVRRITPGEAKDLIAQLPSLLQPSLRALPLGPDKSINRKAVVAELSAQLGLDAAQAERLLAPVIGTIAKSISPGQAEDLRRQLPEDLRNLFTVPRPVDTA